MEPWVIPTVKAGTQVFKHRNEIQNLWDKFISLFSSKTRIAVTGMPGVGKTVLFDYISEKAYGRNYTRPLTSQQEEKEVIKLEGKNLEFIVVPGQQQNPRIKAETNLIDKKPPDGVIHLFANGYASVRDPIAKNALIENGIDTIEKIRQQNLLLELEDLEKTCNLVSRIYNKHNKPMWIAFVANKVDLYADSKQLREAQNKYTTNVHSANNSQIVNKIESLVNQIGKNNIRWQSFYTCSRIEAFEWNNERHMTTLVDENQRDEMLKEFLTSIISYCQNQ